MRYAFTHNGRTHHVMLEEHADGPRFVVEGETFEPQVERNGNGYVVSLGDQTFHFQIRNGHVETREGPMDLHIQRARPKLARAGGGRKKSDGRIKPPMPGKIVETPASEGDTVAEGDVVVILEAMKMQNDIKAPFAGTVTKVYVTEGQNVEATTILVEIEPEEA